MELEFSILLGDVDSVRRILNTNKGLINRCMDYGTPLHFAVYYGHTDVVIELLENGATQMLNSDGETPLILAANKGFASIVGVLLDDNNAGIDIQNPMSGDTALHYAVGNGHIDVVIELLFRGAKQMVNCARITPLIIAVDRGYTLIVEVLLDNCCVGINIQNLSSGDTALHQAAGRGHELIVKKLLGKGAQCDIQNRSGYTPLRHACQEGYQDIVDMLLNNGASPEVPDFNGFYPIHTAAQNDRSLTMNILLKYGCDPNTVSILLCVQSCTQPQIRI